MTTYDPGTTMRDALGVYFADNGFGDGGGYDEAWVDFKLGPIPFPFPNTPARVRAVRYHDLHHILTEYATDLDGEFLISAWEIGAGCKDFHAAWQLNLGGMAAGALYMPRRIFQAFLRGRRSQSFYGLPYDEILDGRVAEARERMGIARADESTARASGADLVLFALALVAGLVTGLISLAVGLLLLPIAYVYFWSKRRSAPRPAQA